MATPGPNQPSRHQIVTPHAMFLVWNYDDRMGGFTGDNYSTGSLSGANAQAVDTTIISTVSLKSIKTNKHKASPVGGFQVTLAPTKNWVNAITPGSWCAILMSQEKIAEVDTFRADPRKLKMFGKITSVRVNTVQDQSDGKRITEYLVEGVDWGHIFESNLYIDPLAIKQDISSVGLAAALGFERMFGQALNDKNLPNTNDIVKALIQLWGNGSPNLENANSAIPTNLLNPTVSFKIPSEVQKYMGFSHDQISSIILESLKVGFLTPAGTYAQTPADSVVVPTAESLVGVHSLWQILTEHTNPVINELIADLSFSGNKPQLELIKRVRPFRVSEDPQIINDDFLKYLGSSFLNVPHAEIPIDRVISFDAGTNWRDKFNFIEVRPVTSVRDQYTTNAVRQNTQLWDEPAFTREGFRPYIALLKNTFPQDANGLQDPLNLYKFKYLLRDWYFNTHRYLNGSVTFVGLNEHIKVGQNIMVDVRVFGDTKNITSEVLSGANTQFLAHVESISHSFTVNDNGLREFFTTVSFVRGIFVNRAKNKIIDFGASIPNSGLDKLSSETTIRQKRNTNNTVSTSNRVDPDPDRYEGE